MRSSNPQVAFIAAAAVLLVLPLLVAGGVGALAAAAQGSPVDIGLLLIVFVIWMVCLIAIVTLLVAHLNRRTRS